MLMKFAVQTHYYLLRRKAESIFCQKIFYIERKYHDKNIVLIKATSSTLPTSLSIFHFLVFPDFFLCIHHNLHTSMQQQKANRHYREGINANDHPGNYDHLLSMYLFAHSSSKHQ